MKFILASRARTRESELANKSGFVAFRYRDFRAYFFARTFNALAVQTADVGIGWLIYSVTNSPLALGIIGLCIFLPNLAFALLSGQVADMYDRKYILVTCNLVSTSAALCLLLASLQENVSVTLMFALVTVLGTARAFANPAGQALVASLVAPEHLANAIALGSTGYQTAIIAGPAIGGALYVFGPHVVFTVTSACFMCSLIAYLIMRPRGVFGRPEKFSLAYMTAGLKFISSKPIILGAITLDLFAVLFGGATAPLPVFARDIFFIGPFGLGVLRTCPALGAFLTSLVLAHYPIRNAAGLRMLQAVGLFGIATICFGLSPSFWIALPFLILIGCTDMMSVYVRTTFIQAETPDHMRGRVAAVNTVFIGASNELGQFESGLVATLLSPVASVVFGGATTVLVAGACARIFPKLRDRDQLI